MLLPVTSEVNDKGHMAVGGVDVTELKEKYGTPLYVYDIATIKKQIKGYRENFSFCDLEAGIIYASKAFICTAICQLMERLGLDLDVSTGGELFTALNSGFPAGRIFFHGNNKSAQEIEYGLDSRVGFFVVDNLIEIEALKKLCREKNMNQKVMLRINPGIKVHTHEYIQTGTVDSKFGFGLESGSALEAVENIKGSSLNLVGIHAHIGSQIFNLSCYDKLIELMLKFISEIKDKTNMSIPGINIGGGLGVNYLPGDNAPGILDLAHVTYGAVKKYEKKFSVNLDKMYLEPGRSIVGNAGITLYEAGATKEIEKVKDYIFIDGGMSDNMRPMLYQARYNAYLANRMGTGKDKMKYYSIAGKHCESGDVIIDHIKLPPVSSGDLIAVATTGAYGYSMSNNYNGQPKSAVVAVEDGKSWTWIKRQTYKDLVIGDVKLYES